MQKTFKLNLTGNKYRVLINQNKKVNIKTQNEEINFYFGNSKYILAESEYLQNFLEYRLCINKASEIKNYILNNI
jgi:hypothetical protein